MRVRVWWFVVGVAVAALAGSAPRSAAQSRSASPTPRAVSGAVADETGGVLPGARVELVAPDGSVRETVTTDAVGHFQFAGVPAGAFVIRATFPGLTPTSATARTTGNVDAVKLVLHLAGRQEGVTVELGGASVSSDPAANLDAVAVSQDDLRGLPVFDQDILGAVSRFLDAGGSGGATLVVNGMEVNALRVSASAIQQIKINQDPYSAEYSRPGRGRIEVLTKPGGQHYNGEFNFVGRDARLDARNAFLTTKPVEHKRILEGVFGGPVGTAGRTSFLFSGNRQQDDQQGVVVATDLTGAIRDSVPQPNTEALASASVTHQVSPHTTMAITPSYQYEANDNQGVGGTTLASAGTTFRHHEQQLRYTHQSALTPNLFLQVQTLVGHEKETTVNASEARGIVVAGAFSGGGAQRDLVRTETHMQVTQSLTWSHRGHTLQAGFQLPDWSRRGFDDRTDVGGTFYFDGLDSYAANRPYAFSYQQGNGQLALLEKQVATYLKDDWQMRRNLSLSVGLRYDWQNYFHDDNNFSPRLSVAYAPRASTRTTLRAGLGWYSDRSGPVILADLIHSQRGDLQRYLITDPPYPDPGISSAVAQARSLTTLAPGVQIPRTIQASVSLDRQLRKGLTMSLGYTESRGYDLFRSRDINAPAPPLYLSRPDLTFGVIRQIESTGRQVGHSFQATLRGQVTRWFNGQTQYTLSRTHNDTNGLGSYPANDYDLSGEWGLADSDRRHRLALLGKITHVPLVDLGIGLTINSAGHYTAVLPEDIYNNGRGRARPAGVARNTLLGAGYAQLDLRASHTFKLPTNDRSWVVSLDAFNVMNRVNYGTFVGTIGSPYFGQAISARASRQLQLSAGVTF
ncbi:MAG: TonB-dependent receptor [Acidobacteriota bacterium]